MPLDYLFPNPPSDDEANPEFKLETDDTWGTGEDEGTEGDPNVRIKSMYTMFPVTDGNRNRRSGSSSSLLLKRYNSLWTNEMAPIGKFSIVSTPSAKKSRPFGWFAQIIRKRAIATKYISATACLVPSWRCQME